jgi:DNA (cytosine-5)-methyltransferase 1
MSRSVYAADLFCGAGGTSTGLLMAAEEMGEHMLLLAVNHWDIAISTHTANHPQVAHYNSDLADIDPLQLVPDGKLRLLVASPECTHFSRARGGKPRSNQSRASVKYVLRWIAALDVENVLIENVPEFQDWGPLHRSGPHEGKQIMARKGEYFRHFIKKIRKSGYTVDWRVLNAADYGDATTRKRLFILARKGHPICWPRATHSRSGRNLAGNLATWRPARDVIDWSVKGESIFRRKKPLSPNTLKRIEAGLRKYSGLPFVIGQQSGAAPRTTESPLPTIAAAGAISLVQPFLIQYHGASYEGGERTSSIDKPLPTVATSNQYALVEPFVMNIDHGKIRKRSSQSRQLAHANHPGDDESLALVQPFIVPVNHGDEARVNSVDAPLPTITGFDALGLAQPFLIMLNGTDRKQLDGSNRSVNEPLPTLTGSGHVGLVEPFMITTNWGETNRSKPRSIDEPVPTIMGHKTVGLVEPYLVEYHGTADAVSVDAPLPTQTGKDRFGLVEPVIFRDGSGRVFMLDIRFRMLRPRELARAMSFPDDYQFQGNREQIVKQIGNAVPVRTARALCKELLT